jgi:5'-3' exonuclease
MIIIDYSAIGVSGVVSMGIEVNENLVRHMLLNSIRSHVHKFKKEYGTEVVIACDDYSWRREQFPHYKHKRRSSRDKSTIDWKELYSILYMVQTELIEYMPYKVIQVPGAEADDVVSVLVESTQEFGRNEKVMIISGDKDFLQLQKYSNVRQYSPLLKKELKETDPSRFLFEHIVRGDTSDGIPNILSNDDVFVTGTRQSPIRGKQVDEWYSKFSNLPEVLGEEVYERWVRNRTLIDLSRVPVSIEKMIMDKYNTYAVPDRSKILKYFIAKRLRNLTPLIEEF